MEFYKKLSPDVAKALGLVVRTKAEDDQHTANQVALKADQLAEQNFNQKFKAQLDDIDARVEKHTGVKRKPTQANEQNEKTTDYIERAFTEYKSTMGTADQKMVQTLQQQLQDQAKTYEQKLAAAENKAFDSEVGAAIETEVKNRKIAIPAHITDANEQAQYVKDQQDMIRTQLRTKYTPKKTEQGIVWNLGDNPQLSQQDGKPLGVGAIVDRDYGRMFVPKGKEQEGGGTPPGGGGPSGFRTKSDIHAHLAKKGLDVYSPEYKTEFQKLMKDAKLDINAAPAEAK